MIGRCNMKGRVTNSIAIIVVVAFDCDLRMEMAAMKFLPLREMVCTANDRQR